MIQNRPRGIVVVALRMIVFGLAEVVTALTHNFVGIVAGISASATYAGGVIGTLYAASGLLILTMRRWAAALAIVFLLGDIIGRIALVVTGSYPTNSFERTLAIITGTVIVAIFAVYIRLKWSFFN
jgi:hypothetical protein